MPQNDAPFLAPPGGTFSYKGGDPAVAVAPDLTGADPDDTHLEGATVAIAMPQPGDALEFTPQFGITGPYNPMTGALTPNGHATLAEYQTALRSVKLGNPMTSAGSRIVAISVTDGTTSSNTVTRMGNISAGP